MFRHTGWTQALWAAAFLAAAAVTNVLAAPQLSDATLPQGGTPIPPTATNDVRDTMGTYLGARATDPKGGAGALAFGPADVRDTRLVIYEAPRLPFEADDARPRTDLASLVYPEVTGLSGGASSRAVPMGNMSNFAMGPGGFCRVMAGRPTEGVENWTQSSQTAISYIRPHLNVQMRLEIDLSGGPPAAGDFEGPGLQPRAALAVDNRTRVDSASFGSGTSRFGGRPARTPVDEPQTAVAAGLDLGILPTFLSQMGMNFSIVASRGQTSGDVKIALVGTTELPVDWAPPMKERPYPGLPVDAILAMYGAPPFPYGGSGIGSHFFPGGPGTPQEPLIPIVPGGGGGPVIPEPATLAMLGVAAAAVLARRFRRSGR